MIDEPRRRKSDSRSLAAQSRAVSGIYLLVDYTNHRGERRMRKIVPYNTTRASPDHPYYPNQWIMQVLDVEKDDYRDLCLLKIHGFQPSTLPERTT